MLVRGRGDGLGQLGVGLGGARPDELDGDHRAAAADVADAVVVGLQAVQPVLHQPLDLPGPLDQAVGLDGLDGGERGGTGERVAAVGAAQAAGVRGVHDRRRPVTADSGRPPAMPLAVTIRSGTTPSWSHANMSPVRAKPVCTSSATKTTPFARHHSASAGRNPGAGSMNPPSPWMGSMTTAARFSAPTCFSIWSIARAAAGSPSTCLASRNG